MKLIYIYHSGFCIQTDKIDIIIDFYKDSKDQEGVIYKDILPNGKKKYVLCTHSHLDHYNGEVLNWKREVDDITYIFSQDVFEAGMANRNDAIYLDKLDEYSDDYIKVKAYGSTDVGESFYIEVDGVKIFHAGDLNNWHWNEESTPEEIEVAEGDYAKELSILSSEVKKIDIAMFPIDPRLGKDFMKGAEQFIEAIDVDFLAPMHFDENYDKIKSFDNIAKKYDTRYWTITEKGQSIKL